MKKRFKKLAGLICSGIIMTNIFSVPFSVMAQEQMINVISSDNAKFTMVSSSGTYDGKKALDNDIITNVNMGGYDGAPVYDVNGKDGKDYIILMTIEADKVLPVEKIKMYYEHGIAYIGGEYYANGASIYEGKAEIPWFENVDIFASDTAEDNSWEKVCSFDSFKDMLKEEKMEEEIWDDTDGIRHFYEIPLGKKIDTKYLRIAIGNVKPWLGGIVINEIEALAKESDLAGEYHKINIDKSEDIEIKATGTGKAGEFTFAGGSEVILTVKPGKTKMIKSVELDGKALEEKDGKYSFVMPSSDCTLKAVSKISEYEDVAFNVVDTNVVGGEVVEGGIVPVVTFVFNRETGTINKDMILVNGQENTGLIQHAFADAKDRTKVYVVPFSDKLESDREYNIQIKDTAESLGGKKLEGKAQVSFRTSADYTSYAVNAQKGYIKGYEDDTFRPENNITLKEALIIAERISPDNDFNSVKNSNDYAKRLDIGEIIYIILNGKRLESEEDMFQALIKEGIFNGYEDGSFRMMNNITRAEAVALFNRVLEKQGKKIKFNEYSLNKFRDVPAEHWAAKEIGAAVGYNGYKFPWAENVNQNVTYDVMNKKNNVWKQIPIVSKEQREMGINGGEGGQWLQSIEIDEVDGELMFVGVDIATILRSVDGGKSWTRSSKGFLAGACMDIEIDPNNKNRVLSVGGLSEYTMTGLYLSEDMGESWNQVKSYISEGSREIRDQIAWDKSSYDEEIGGSRVAYWSNTYKIRGGNQPEAYMSNHKTDQQGGLYKTEDGGKTWNLISEEMSDSVIKVNPVNGDLYIGNERGFHVSRDGGKTFKTILSGEPVYGLDVIQTKPDNVYINDSKGVLVSTDGARTFTRRKNEDFPVKEDLSDVRNITRALAVSPANPDYMLVDCRDHLRYNNRRYFSHDGGDTWNECGYDDSKDFFFNHNRQHPFAWHPTNPDKVWSFGGDWITSSDNGGETFIWDNEGNSGTPPGGRWNFNPYKPERIYAGAQDLLGVITYDGGYTWRAIEAKGGFGCSYGTCAVDENTLIAANADGWYDPRSLFISRDAGETWEKTGLPLKNGHARRATSFWISPTDPNTVIAGEYVSHDKADTWKEMVGCEMVMAINYYHNRELWGLNKEVIVVSYDNGETWYPFSEVRVDDAFSNSSVTSMFTSGSGVHVWDMEYDGINDIIYYLPGNIYSGATLVRIDNDNTHKNLGKNIHPQYLMDDRWYQLLALDPRHPDVLYLGGYGSTASSHQTAGVQRSCDRGESFQIISAMGDINSVVNEGPSAGEGPETLVVHPETGELWMWDRAEGFWTFPAPYEN